MGKNCCEKMCCKIPNTVATLGYKYLIIQTGKFSCVTSSFNDRWLKIDFAGYDHIAHNMQCKHIVCVDDVSQR